MIFNNKKEWTTDTDNNMMILRTKGCMLHGSVYMKFLNRQVLFCEKKWEELLTMVRGSSCPGRVVFYNLSNDLVTNDFIFVKVSSCAFKISGFIAWIKCDHVPFTFKGKKTRRKYWTLMYALEHIKRGNVLVFAIYLKWIPQLRWADR